MSFLRRSRNGTWRLASAVLLALGLPHAFVGLTGLQGRLAQQDAGHVGLVTRRNWMEMLEEAVGTPTPETPETWKKVGWVFFAQIWRWNY